MKKLILMTAIMALAAGALWAQTTLTLSDDSLTTATGAYQSAVQAYPYKWDITKGDVILQGIIDLGGIQAHVNTWDPDLGDPDDFFGLWGQIGLSKDPVFNSSDGVWFVTVEWLGGGDDSLTQIREILHMQEEPGTQPMPKLYTEPRTIAGGDGDDTLTIELQIHSTGATTGWAKLWIHGVLIEGDMWSVFDPDSLDFTGEDLSNAYVLVGVMSGNNPNNPAHTFSWSNLTVTGYPASYSEVWVDSAWVGTAPGTVVEPGKYFGFNAFAEIQDGIDAVAVGGTVYVAAGTYTEEVEFDNTRDGITLSGANAGIPGYGTRGAESIIEGPNVLHGNAIYIFDGADGVIIDGFTLKAGDDIVENRADEVVIKNNIITPVSGTPADPNAPGIFACECINVTISYNYILYTGGIGMFLGLASYSADFTGLITHNLIDNSGGAGILANYTTGGLTIEYNTIMDVGHDGIRAGASAHGMTIQYNEIYGSARDGVRIVNDATSHHINYNSIYNSVAYGVNNLDAAATVDASGNWWGTNTPGGVAGEISDSVDYTPWLDSGTDTDPGPGFQGDFTVLDVDDDSPQSGTTGRIQEGVNLVTGSTVNVMAGTYVEQITVGKSLTLLGAGESVTTIQAPAADRPGSVIVDGNTHDYILAAYPSSGIIEVRIEGFTIDANGENMSSGTARFVGVFFRDVNGSNAGLFSCTIKEFATTEYESWGVLVYGDADLTIDDNDVSGFTRDGIDAIGDDGAGVDPNVVISNNTVTGSSVPLNGIYVGRGATGTISGNTVKDLTRSSPWAAVGILLYQSDGITVNGGNIVENCWDGIVLLRSDGSTVSGNTLTDNIAFHIGLDESDNNQVFDNTITGTTTGTEDKAISLSNGATGNTIGGATVTDGNDITLATSGTGLLYGIYIQSTVGTGSNTIQYNTFNGGTRFVQVDGGNSGTTTVADNTVTGCSFAGLYLNAGSVVISGNTLTNTVRPVEFWGAADVTISENLMDGSTYDGINCGSFTGSVTISGNAIINIPGLAVHNRTTTLINASGNWLGDNTPAGVAAEVSDYVDYTPWLDVGTDTEPGTPGFQGDFTVLDVDDDSPQTGTTGRIQEGVDLVTGSTVNVMAGTYEAQVVIGKELTLVGAGKDVTVIQSPTTLTEYFTTSADNYPIVYIHDEDVTIENFTIDGLGRGNANYRFVGIGFWNAGGSITNVDLTGVRDTPFSGAQHGVGVYAYNNTGGPYTIDLSGVTIDDFQKNATALSGDGLTANLSNCTVIGHGLTNVTAQNGIQIGFGAGGTVTDCSVSDIAYDDTTWGASGMLFYWATLVDVSGSCSVSNSQSSIVFHESNGSVDGAIVLASDANNKEEGISVRDYGEIKASGSGLSFAATSPLVEEWQNERGQAGAPITVTLSNLALTGVLQDHSYGIGVWAIGDDVNVTITKSTIQDWEIGVVAKDSVGSVTVVADSNTISGNDFGVWTNAASVQNFENNNWGASDGPEDSTGTAEAYIGQCYSVDSMKNTVAEFFPIEGLGNSVSDNVDYCPWIPWNCCVVRGDVNHSGTINVVDLSYLVDYLFFEGPAPPCFEEGDVDGSIAINVVDLTYLVDYLFFFGPPPPSC